MDGKRDQKAFELSYYGRVLDRIMSQNIIEYYAKHHNINMAVAGRGMLERADSPEDEGEFKYDPGHARYSSYGILL